MLEFAKIPKLFSNQSLFVGYSVTHQFLQKASKKLKLAHPPKIQKTITKMPNMETARICQNPKMLEKIPKLSNNQSLPVKDSLMHQFLEKASKKLKFAYPPKIQKIIKKIPNIETARICQNPQFFKNIITYNGFLDGYG